MNPAGLTVVAKMHHGFPGAPLCDMGVAVVCMPRTAP